MLDVNMLTKDDMKPVLSMEIQNLVLSTSCGKTILYKSVKCTRLRL